MSIFQISLIQRLRTLGLLLLSFIPFISSSGSTQSGTLTLPSSSEEVTFPSGNLVLHGFIHKPSGNGLFPAILLNHGSEQFPKSMLYWAQPYTQKGYVVFAPHRRG
jgi:carboxymethylenebutenolidase